MWYLIIGFEHDCDSWCQLGENGRPPTIGPLEHASERRPTWQCRERENLQSTHCRVSTAGLNLGSISLTMVHAAKSTTWSLAAMGLPQTRTSDNANTTPEPVPPFFDNFDATRFTVDSNRPSCLTAERTAAGTRHWMTREWAWPSTTVGSAPTAASTPLHSQLHVVPRVSSAYTCNFSGHSAVGTHVSRVHPAAD